MDKTKITFVGGGNMSFAIVRGLGESSPYDIHVSEPSSERAAWLREHAPFTTVHADNLRACHGAAQVVLAVKPQIMAPVCANLAEAAIKPELGFASIAAGIATTSLERWLGNPAAVIRVMPNQAAFVGHSMTVLYAAQKVSKSARDLAQELLATVGQTLWLDDEALMDAATAVSGSGPGFLYRVFEVMVDAACELGFTPAQADTLVRATALGAGTVVTQNQQELSALRASVTSPGGTTEAGLLALAEADIRAIFIKALTAARDKGRHLRSASEKDS
ncbi:MAG: pyrroline-5-carboxylate reductase [Pseudomonadota bacterium]